MTETALAALVDFDTMRCCTVQAQVKVKFEAFLYFKMLQYNVSKTNHFIISNNIYLFVSKWKKAKLVYRPQNGVFRLSRGYWGCNFPADSSWSVRNKQARSPIT